jgi:hypothetical protein
MPIALLSCKRVINDNQTWGSNYNQPINPKCAYSTGKQIVLDVASRIVEVNSPICGSFTLILPGQGSTQSCAFSMMELPLKKIPVVCEYVDVFPDELPGMPPD